jgi:hypothetical protein
MVQPPAANHVLKWEWSTPASFVIKAHAIRSVELQSFFLRSLGLMIPKITTILCTFFAVLA